MNTLLRSVSIRISPGNLPNQVISQGAKCRIAPITISIIPAVIIQRAIVTRCLLTYFHSCCNLMFQS